MENIWSLHRRSEDTTSLEFRATENHQLLWFFAADNEILPCLKSGIKSPIGKSPYSSNGRVGTGIYMFDEIANAFSHCRQFVNARGERSAILFLVEAALGNQYTIYHDDSSLVAAPPGFDSVVAKSKRSPQESGDAILTFDGVDVKVSTLPRNTNTKDEMSTSFSYDLLVVYKNEQVRLRYAVTVTMTPDSGDY